MGRGNERAGLPPSQRSTDVDWFVSSSFSQAPPLDHSRSHPDGLRTVRLITARRRALGSFRAWLRHGLRRAQLRKPLADGRAPNESSREDAPGSRARSGGFSAPRNRAREESSAGWVSRVQQSLPMVHSATLLLTPAATCAASASAAPGCRGDRIQVGAGSLAGRLRPISALRFWTSEGLTQAESST